MLHYVTLHLARSKQFPEGSSRYGYVITVPLDAEGHLDQDEWALKRDRCRVHRFWANEGERQGVLVHRPGGAGGATWMIDYNQDRPGDEEAGYRLHQHRFAEGEYVTIEDDDGKPYTFQVVSVTAAEPGRAGEHR
ncbi:hypothetical protein [Microvirga tunisiensis]|uniref:Uncharacterized protein n=1 Tax=Microvirga tunisiensis TaxID=2108360 RepID=A0A5N7MED3_9HYPH|nr:hypothetical protein [Microvirga tunisiensis]MPR06145.1 hypothetical protein [Microvirga tunisiensis]MPR25225.1 hypothetical protein [Microvirga tunisiensis]